MHMIRYLKPNGRHGFARVRGHFGLQCFYSSRNNCMLLDFFKGDTPFDPAAEYFLHHNSQYYIEASLSYN